MDNVEMLIKYYELEIFAASKIEVMALTVA